MADNFDQVALVVDWLDACRKRDIVALLELYADDATLDCRCSGIDVREGRAALEAYWRPRLEALAPCAFGLQDIKPTDNGVLLDYLNHDGKPVRTAFAFTRDGKIRQTGCKPA